jgi:hypothetical protein
MTCHSLPALGHGGWTDRLVGRQHPRLSLQTSLLAERYWKRRPEGVRVP